jgi:hypothetical protein
MTSQGSFKSLQSSLWTASGREPFLMCSSDPFWVGCHLVGVELIAHRGPTPVIIPLMLHVATGTAHGTLLKVLCYRLQPAVFCLYTSEKLSS